MANGEPFDMHDPTIAAHRKYPFGTVLRVKNLETGVTHTVVVQDRGPYTDDPSRTLDLSKAAARRLGFLENGIANLRVTVLRRDLKKPSP
jgi:rare lipoprotein A